MGQSHSGHAGQPQPRVHGGGGLSITARAVATWSLLIPGGGGPYVPGWSSRRLQLIPRRMSCREVQAGEGGPGPWQYTKDGTPYQAPAGMGFVR